jgi:hypothetical protein
MCQHPGLSVEAAEAWFARKGEERGAAFIDGNWHDDVIEPE